MFGGCTKQSWSPASSAMATSIESKVHQISEAEGKLSKNSRQHQNKINQWETQIKSLQNQNKQLQGFLDPKLLVNAINQAVTTGLKLGSQLTRKGGIDSRGTGFVSQPYLGEPRPSQLAPSADGSLNAELECCYCKDTGHQKENCIKLNHQVDMEQKSNQKIAPTTHASNTNNKVAN